MSVYKNENPNYLDIALRSITECQSILPEEIVLIADGPLTEKLDSVISDYCEKYSDVMKVIRLEENRGLGGALKVALDNCKNELVARMDSDDIAVPDRFEQQLKAFESDPALDIIGGDISEFIGDEKNIVAYRRVPLTDKDIKENMKIRCPFNHVSVMFRKSAVQAAGGYLDLFWNEDYFLWIRLAERGAIMANTGTVLVNVRTGKDMYRRRGGSRYFKSEKFLQKYMLSKKMINRKTYFFNLVKRWIVQCALPNSLRGFVLRNFARSK